MYLRTEGVILARKNFGEADRLLCIYTRDFGKIWALVKGVKKLKSKKAGHVEIGNWCKIFLAKGKNLDLVCEVETKHAFGILDFNEERANKIYHLLELVESLVAQNQKNIEVYKLLVEFLGRVSRDEDFYMLVNAFKVKLLVVLGFFSFKNLPKSQIRDIFEILEVEDIAGISSKSFLNKESYLKLSAFLDSIIENLTQTRLKTVRFL